MTAEDAHFRLRLPPELHAQLTEIAQKNRRSVNAEVVSRLQASLKWDEYDPASISEMSTDIAGLREDVDRVMDVLRERGLMR